MECGPYVEEGCTPGAEQQDEFRSEPNPAARKAESKRRLLSLPWR